MVLVEHHSVVASSSFLRVFRDATMYSGSGFVNIRCLPGGRFQNTASHERQLSWPTLPLSCLMRVTICLVGNRYLSGTISLFVLCSASDSVL